IVTGAIVTPINQAVQNFKDWWQTVVDSFFNIGANIQGFIDSVWRGFTRALGVGGKSPSDVANAAANASEQADTAQQISEWNNAILGIRNNKALWTGIDETEESTFLLTDLFDGNSEPPFIEAGHYNVPMAFWRATEDAKKGFISWL